MTGMRAQAQDDAELADEQLARQAAAGDETAFATLLERHYDRIFRVAFAVLGRRDLAQDVAQDVCVALARKLARFDGRARFSSWLYRVTVNAARDRLRREAAHDRAALGWGEVVQLRGAADHDAQDDILWLHEAMTRLDADLRATAALVLGEELTHAEAARALGVSEGTISWRMNRLRRRLRDMAAQEGRMT